MLHSKPKGRGGYVLAELLAGGDIWQLGHDDIHTCDVRMAKARSICRVVSTNHREIACISTWCQSQKVRLWGSYMQTMCKCRGDAPT